MLSWAYERYAILKAAAGIRWGVISLLVLLAVARLKWFSAFVAGETTGAGSMIFGFPTDWLLGLVAFLALWVWWLIEYAVKLRRQINDARVEISKLRKRGVELRNGGQSITSMAGWLEWRTATLDWHRDVVAEMRKISVADAEWWDCLDVVPSARLPVVQEFNAPGAEGEHMKRYGEHDFQVKRLGEMIRDLWGRR